MPLLLLVEHWHAAVQRHVAPGAERVVGKEIPAPQPAQLDERDSAPREPRSQALVPSVVANEAAAVVATALGSDEDDPAAIDRHRPLRRQHQRYLGEGFAVAIEVEVADFLCEGYVRAGPA